MRLNLLYSSVLSVLLLTGCCHKGPNPDDPYESFNRKVHKFNMAVDSALIKPPAKFYKAVVPGFIRKGINNAFNNVDMLPSIANDVLQAEGKWAIKDTWRFVINSTLGVGGLFDVASTFGLPPHYNDLGLTFAKWGDKNSPYIVIPLIGPSTIRDGSGWLVQFALWTPYVYINNDAVAYGLVGMRYLDLRTQLLDSEPLMDEALDKYAFIRDAYLQRRAYLINGTEQDNGELYIEDEAADKAAADKAQQAPVSGIGSDYVPE